MGDCVPFYGTRQSITNFQFVAFDGPHQRRLHPDIQPLLTGHLFQGRFKAILVDSDSYLLQVCRYVDLNPVRAHMVDRTDAYRWSSYRALAGLADRPDWLDVHSVHEQVAPGRSPQAADLPR